MSDGLSNIPTLYTWNKTHGAGYQLASMDDITSGRYKLMLRWKDESGIHVRPADPSDVAAAVEALRAKESKGGFTPSVYQANIFEFVQNGRGDGFVDAVAGSGKTTTLVKASELTRGSALFLAFNRHIVSELKDRLPKNMEVSTIHGIGKRALDKVLGRTNVDDHKYRNLARDLMKAEQIEDEDGEIIAAIMDLTRFVQSSLVKPTDQEAIDLLIEQYGIEIPYRDEAFVRRAMVEILRAGIEIAKKQKVISFSDMLWLPHALNNPKWVKGGGVATPTYFWVMVDEAQDLSAAQLALAMKSRAAGGRMLFVGDPKQAIYAFAGADCRSVENIVAATKAKVLPLSVCYRCPSSHIELAQSIVPHLEARPGAPEGEVHHITEDTMPNLVREGDLILCRMTAPLLSACFSLIAAGVGARVRGREIGKGLVRLLRKAMKIRQEGQTMIAAIDLYESETTRALSEMKNSEAKIESLNDQVNCLRVIYESTKPKSVDEFEKAIDSLFDDGRPAVMLSTIHRAKGLEEDRVFILHPEKMPSRMARTADQMAQEQHLIYVAYTRAKKVLFFVPETAKKK